MTIIADARPLDALFQVTRGKPATFRLEFEDEAKAPIDITSDHVEVRVLDRPDGHLVDAFGSGGVKTITVHIDPVAGETQLTFTEAELADAVNEGKLTVRHVQVDRLIGGAGGQRVPWWHGALEIHPA